MKLIYFVILIIISLNSISSSYTRSDIIKNSKSKKRRCIGKCKETINKIKPQPIDGGTRIKTIDIAKLDHKQRSKFLAYCIISGLTNNEQVSKAHQWALNNKYIGGDDNILIDDFAQKASNQFKTEYRKDWKIKWGDEKGHFWIEDSKGNEVFNSKGIGNYGN